MEMRCALNDLQDLKVTHDLDLYKGAACESSLEFRSSFAYHSPSFNCVCCHSALSSMFIKTLRFLCF